MQVIVRMQPANPRENDWLFVNGAVVTQHETGSKLYSEMIAVQKGKRVTSEKETYQIFSQGGKYLIKCPTHNTDVHNRKLNVWILLIGVQRVRNLSPELLQQLYNATTMAQFEIDTDALEKIILQLAHDIFPLRTLCIGNMQVRQTIAGIWHTTR